MHNICLALNPLFGLNCPECKQDTNTNNNDSINIQIDSFIYREEGELKLYPLVEVNYRKTMGLVIQSLADKFSEARVVEWIIKTKKEIREDEDFYKDEHLVRISPDDSHFQSYYKKHLL